MVKKLRKLAYTYAVFSSVIIAFLFYFLMKGVSAVFDILPDLLVIDYIEELFSIHASSVKVQRNHSTN